MPHLVREERGGGGGVGVGGGRGERERERETERERERSDNLFAHVNLITYHCFQLLVRCSPKQSTAYLC